MNPGLWGVYHQPGKNVGDETKAAGDRSIAYSLLQCLSFHQMTLLYEACPYIRALTLPHSLLATLFLRSHLDFRPWTRIPNDQRDETVSFPR